MRRLLLALIVVLIAALFVVTWIPIRQARALWLAHHDAEAIAKAESWSRLHLWPAQYHQILAAAYLGSGRRAQAKPHLDAIGSPWISAVALKDIAAVRQNAVYLRLLRQPDGVAVGRVAMPQLPSSQRQILLGAGQAQAGYAGRGRRSLPWVQKGLIPGGCSRSDRGMSRFPGGEAP